ncbi:MAG: hypothetical protein JWQ97_3571 [Phenylobacterium sp.]|nr:hypothetical protein [Phenylobacterium sp.]
MRRPRDIDAELQALSARTKALKARRITQLGELVIATGAETLELEVLAGALLGAAAEKSEPTRASWKQAGAAFFRGRGTAPGGGAARDRQGASARGNGEPTP